MAETFEMKYSRKVRRWVFPEDRFVNYGPEDEQWCRYFGIGREIECDQIITIPRAFVDKVHPDGSMEILCLSEPEITYGVTS